MNSNALNLPSGITKMVQPVLDILPLDAAMNELVVTEPVAEAWEAVNSVAADLQKINPALAAGLWLYVDDLDRSHAISQSLPDATGSFWHGIMHRREGDFSNSHYWFRKTGHHPAMDQIADYEPHAFIDAVAERTEKTATALQSKQREEWTALFEWCANPDR